MDNSGKQSFGDKQDLRVFLDRKVAEYNRPSFIPDDPVSVPHRFSQKQDIEIAGFLAAIFSWGNRRTIINKSMELMQLMEQAPFQFVRQHTGNDLKRLLNFKHRTFNATDLLYFIAFFRYHYERYDSLEDAFLLPGGDYEGSAALTAFHHYFFSVPAEESILPEHAFSAPHTPSPGRRPPSPDKLSPGIPFPPGGSWTPLAPPRTRKHVASPEKNSSCKRINMFLRWMVRKDDKGVDFGLWNRIPMSGLICPLDLHVARVAKRFGLLTRERSDWQAAADLTACLSLLDKDDPVKYDFALFGLGVMEKF